MWSRKYQCCQQCGTTENRHKGKGLCLKCYGINSWKNTTPEQRKAINNAVKARYESSPDIPAKRNLDRRERYQSDSEYRESKIRLASQTYWSNPEDIRQKSLDRYYANHPESLDKSLIERDGFKCTLCESPNDLVVHHKDGNGRGKQNPNNDLANLETLCRSCHMKVHFYLEGEDIV